MDQVKIGRFIAKLRREQGFTQEALGRKLGVTNKTVSRWENGNYMPDIEMLQLLAQTFQVSMDDLLAGERQPGETTQETIQHPASIFSMKEQEAYWKKKWRQEHKGLCLLLLAVLLGMIIVPIVTHQLWWMGLVPLAACLAYGYQNNRMMRFVESKVFAESNHLQDGKH